MDLSKPIKFTREMHPTFGETDMYGHINTKHYFDYVITSRWLYLKEQGVNRTKSGIMLGLGEMESEVLETLHDLRDANVDVVTIGQYLQPSKKLLQVKEFITPEQFDKYAQIAKDIGFIHVESGPLVRSSYKAHKHIS